ncbi:MAG: ATP-dependent Clp protease adaptor protein ClpS [Planctomycetota bacterium]|jgi:ATP-dependent Clp protease adaptor protein ClpS
MFTREAGSSSSVYGSSPGTKIQPRFKPKTQLATPWNVIVHDDPVTLMTYVTVTLRQLFGFSQAKAHKLMMEIHELGKSVVWTGPKEQAELHLIKLHAAQLLATIERVDS